MKFRNMVRKYYPVTIASGLALASSFAQAAVPAAPDVTEVVSYLLLFIAVIATIGSTLLLIAGTIAGFRWLRGAVR